MVSRCALELGCGTTHRSTAAVLGDDFGELLLNDAAVGVLGSEHEQFDVERALQTLDRLAFRYFRVEGDEKQAKIEQDLSDAVLFLVKLEFVVDERLVRHDLDRIGAQRGAVVVDGAK